MGGASKFILVAAAAAGSALQVAASASEIAVQDGAPSTRVKLLPIGRIEMRDARGPFQIRDKAHAEAVVAATRTWLGNADFMFDYDHQVAYAVKPGVGGQAIAAGWCKPANLTVETDGIYANDVEWTVAAQAKLTGREYRYISPLFMAAQDGGDVLHLKNAALVNIGAIDLPAVAAGHSEETDQMDLAALLALLGLKPDASPEAIAAAVTDMKTKAAAAPSTSTIAIAAGLTDGATVEEIAAAVATLKTAGVPDPAKFVPIDQVSGLTAQLAVLTGERAEREIAAAVECGKLAPSMKAWGISLFKSNETAWTDYLAGAPVIVAAGAALGDRKPAEKATTLTADEVAACAAIGMSHEEFLTAKNAEIA
ncbi:phage protease [Sphingomonas sp. AR_OL41]|uniref:phage protease n=1 Tax=Sphingomonas sp. AR_OL41 TaxID=3042729 RepID=UPI00248024DD|nr:phage protease [Sphingomonas sp. AR_OL41]MDH7971773.1 phage protease [Sphingomonas sp. AR_OL41]